MGGWCGTVNETLKAQITPSAAKVRHPLPCPQCHSAQQHQKQQAQFHSYIKPQLGPKVASRETVVSYLVPTSNHNCPRVLSARLYVVSYLVPTSNHNNGVEYQISIDVVSYLVPTSNHNSLQCQNKITNVVSYLVPTSNHNSCQRRVRR